MPIRSHAPRLHFVADETPPETTALFEAAAQAQGVRFRFIEAPRYREHAAAMPRPGDLLFRAGTTLRALRVEQLLAVPHVATLYARTDDVFLHNSNAALWLSRRGVATPKTIYGAARDRAGLREDVAALGGLPVVVKTLGLSGGEGVMLAESWRALYSMVDYAHAHGHEPLLREYLADAIHWRVIVVGDDAWLAYSNPTLPDDFRSAPTLHRAAYHARVPKRLATLAVRATKALGLQHGGVDILVRAQRQVVLEVNFPCAFATAQRISGVDIAGAIVAHLRAKATALR